MDPTSPSWPPMPLSSSPRTRVDSLGSNCAYAPASKVVGTFPTGAPTSEFLRLPSILAAGPAAKPLPEMSGMAKLSSGASKRKGSVPRATSTSKSGATSRSSAPMNSGLICAPSPTRTRQSSLSCAWAGVDAHRTAAPASSRSLMSAQTAVGRVGCRAVISGGEGDTVRPESSDFDAVRTYQTRLSMPEAKGTGQDDAVLPGPCRSGGRAAAMTS